MQLSKVIGKTKVTNADLFEELKDLAGTTYWYFGWASPGNIASTSSAIWRIARYTLADGTWSYADGDTNFDNIWANRASLTYGAPAPVVDEYFLLETGDTLLMETGDKLVLE